MPVVLVGTPIGNREDLSERAKETLRSADLIACEDTRHSEKLLGPLGARGERISYHEHNEPAAIRRIVAAAREGKTIAVISDAGMPGISDPGYRLVRACAEEEIELTCVPGPSALVMALSLSGLPTDRFAFEGFLPAKQEARLNRIKAVAAEERTLVFYESPRRVLSLLEDLLEILGDRPAALARELTKIHEEILRLPLSEMIRELSNRDEIRGEIVLAVSGAPEREGGAEEAVLREKMAQLEEAGFSRRDIAKLFSIFYQIPKKEAYSYIHEK